MPQHTNSNWTGHYSIGFDLERSDFSGPKRPIICSMAVGTIHIQKPPYSLNRDPEGSLVQSAQPRPAWDSVNTLTECYFNRGSMSIRRILKFVIFRAPQFFVARLFRIDSKENIGGGRNNKRPVSASRPGLRRALTALYYNSSHMNLHISV